MFFLNLLETEIVSEDYHFKWISNSTICIKKPENQPLFIESVLGYNNRILRINILF